jgi:hypothetical protein
MFLKHSEAKEKKKMNYKDFFVRPMSLIPKEAKKEYYESIASPRGDLDVRQLQNLFSDSFSHHVTPNLNAPSDKLEIIKNNDKSDRVISSDNLSAFFIKNCYKIPLITTTDSMVKKDRDLNLISLDDFIKDISVCSKTSKDDSSFNIGSNRVSYLIGGVGRGKSAFIIKIMEILHNTPKDDQGLTIPVYIDFEAKNVNADGTLRNIDESFYVYLYKETIRTIQTYKKFDDIADINSLVLNPDITDHYICLKRLSCHLATKKLRIIYFLDNLDRYHFYFSRYSFYTEYCEDQYKSVTTNIKGLINAFNQPSMLGMCGFSVLFICRRYVYQYLLHTNDPALPQNDKSTVYQVISPNELDILNSRLHLYGEAIDIVSEETPRKGVDWKETVRALTSAFIVKKIKQRVEQFGTEEKYSYNHSSLEAISQLSHHGYRSFVRFLSSLYLNYKDSDVMERLLTKQPLVLIILFITDLKKRYAESNNHFPNIFLNDCMISLVDNFKNAHKPHFHTYWIKYLVLKMLGSQNNVTLEDIIEIFHSIGGYERHLILYTLGALCESNKFRCAEIDYSFPICNINKRRIALTNRGRFMIETDQNMFFGKTDKAEFCFSFIYLQLIIDDLFLSIPEPWFSKVYKNINYSYLYENDEHYGEESWKHVSEKATAVLYFLRILKASLSAEKTLRSDMFDLLSKKGVSVDFCNIEKSVLVELKHLYSAFKKNESYELLNNIWTNIDKDNQFDKFFTEYYQERVLVK